MVECINVSQAATEKSTKINHYFYQRIQTITILLWSPKIHCCNYFNNQKEIIYVKNVFLQYDCGALGAMSQIYRPRAQNISMMDW